MHVPKYPPTMSRQTFGSLQVSVTQDPLLGPELPIGNIPVTIRTISPDGTGTVIAELTTNELGRTEIIEIETPPEELSLVPEYTEQPFSSYTVSTESPDWVGTMVVGTQIFPNTLSVQPTHLQPVSRSMAYRSPRQSSLRQQQEIFIIGPPTLFGNFEPKIPEDEIKPMPPGSGFVTLDNVVVPEFIVVHDGTPNNQAAPNYTIRYIDYIKNVACSEIYPTWPSETIRANVYAIVSFTLNRVFTEWYRNQGKPFTITSSTAFDHAFFHGRNIFANVAQIVDEVFNVFINRTGVQQPLLAQYCDGRRVQCPGWMTQWGSKSLGDQGVNAENILKSFYGQNIRLLGAPNVQGIPESYPGTPLRVGSSGPAVRKMQEQLNRISDHYPAIPKIAADGDFGPATEEAVKTFQRVFNLTVDGIVGRATWYRISQVYTAVTRMAELN